MEKLVEVAQDAINESYVHVLAVNAEFGKNEEIPLASLKMSLQVYTYSEFYIFDYLKLFLRISIITSNPSISSAAL